MSYSDHLTVDVTSGAVSTRTAFDCETPSPISMVVTAYNPMYPSMSVDAPLAITLTPVNEAAPSFLGDNFAFVCLRLPHVAQFLD
jgi:hypothetical protein